MNSELARLLCEKSGRERMMASIGLSDEEATTVHVYIEQQGHVENENDWELQIVQGTTVYSLLYLGPKALRDLEKFFGECAAKAESIARDSNS
jgi:hypothetical protein